MFYSGFNIIRKITTQKWSINRLDSALPLLTTPRGRKAFGNSLVEFFPWGSNKEEKHRKNKKTTKFKFVELLICGCKNIHGGHVSEFNFEKMFLRVNFLEARSDEICTQKKGIPYNCMYKSSIYKLGVQSDLFWKWLSVGLPPPPRINYFHGFDCEAGCQGGSSTPSLCDCVDIPHKKFRGCV